MKRTTWMAALLIACSLLTMAVEPEKTKELTLQETIALALKNNVNLQIRVSDSEVSRQQHQIQTGAYFPTLSFNVENRETNRPSSGVFDGADVNNAKAWAYGVSISQKTPLNGAFEVGLSNTRRLTNSKYSTVNPELGAELTLNLSQPLLKGFGTLAANKLIRIAANDFERSRHQLKQSVIDLAYEVEGAYWNLVFAYQNLEAKKTSLQQSQDLLRQNEIKVKVGTAAPIEVLEAKADVANYEGQLIGAEKEIQTREEELKRLLNLSREDQSLIPSERPQVETLAVEVNALLEEALENRPDMAESRLNLKNQDIEVRYQRNQSLPDLQLTARYYTTGQGGDQLIFAPGTNPLDPGDPIGIVSRGVWDAISETFKNKYRNYVIGVEFKLPIGFKVEKAQLAIAKLNMEKALLTLKNTENTVYSEVKQVLKELETNRKLVEANRISVELYEQKLRAEEKKMSVGLSTNFQVLQYLSQYSDAQNRALQSQISYKLTLARMNKVLGRTLKAFNISFSDIEPAQ
jgi:outer membrane protein TolC